MYTENRIRGGFMFTRESAVFRRIFHPKQIQQNAHYLINCHAFLPDMEEHQALTLWLWFWIAIAATAKHSFENCKPWLRSATQHRERYSVLRSKKWKRGSLVIGKLC
ncbi:hypothetical protein JM78_27710 [Burkholderia pyrrocinia]|nr:hypothetical protein JM78_27710 [Burkholderia pyrrocinia]